MAYALTIHKTQGSEFGTTFLVIPNPCRVLSREMLYTALTRHTGKVIILHQGDFRELQRFSHDEASEVARRMTNLFRPSRPVEVRISNQSVFLDSNLIYRTERGELVRSKSEWIIADKLHAASIDYQYEQPLVLAGIERFPDFTIVDDDSGSTWYWEHNGMLSDKDYLKRWERKLAAYREQGILRLEEGGGENGTLLVTEEQAGTGLDAEAHTNQYRCDSGVKMRPNSSPATPRRPAAPTSAAAGPAASRQASPSTPHEYCATRADRVPRIAATRHVGYHNSLS